MPEHRFQISSVNARRKLACVARTVRAYEFRAILLDFLRKTLTTVARLTPARDLSIIRAAQDRQYDHRIDYIPSYHELTDPMLIVDESGRHWIHCAGKWYIGDWRLPNNVEAAYLDLLSERERRMQTPREAFIANRAQARFLYRKSWWQVGNSIGLNIPVGQASNSFSRHNPPELPPNGYAVLSHSLTSMKVDVYNPFLDQPSRYKSFSRRAIFQEAVNRHRSAFQKALDSAYRREVRRAAQ